MLLLLLALFLVLLLLLLLLALFLVLLLLLLLFLLILFLLLHCLLSIFAGFLLFLFQLFDFLFQLLGILSVLNQLVLVSGNGSDLGAFPQSILVDLFRDGKLLQGLLGLLQGGIQLLGLQGLSGLLEHCACLLMIQDAEILRGSGPDFGGGIGRGDHLFIQLNGFRRILFLGLRFQSEIEQFFRRKVRRLFFLLFFNRGLRFFLFLRLVRHGLRGHGEGQSGQAADQQEPGRGAGGEIPAFPQQQPETEQDECTKQRIERPFDRTRLFAAVDIVFFQLFDPGFNLLKTGMGGGGTDINAAGFGGQSGQHLFVERHTDHIAAGVFQRLDIALFVAQLHDRGLRRIADAEDEQRDLQLDDPVQRLGTLAGQLIAVGNQDDRPVRGFRCAEPADRFRQRLLDVGAAYRNGIDRKFVHTLQKTGLVDGQRTFEKSIAGKRDQAEPVAGIAGAKLTDQPFGVIEPGRPDILRKHAFGNIEHDHQIASLSVVRQDPRAPGRTCGRRQQQDHGPGKQDRPPEPENRRSVHSGRIIGLLSEKLLQQDFPFPAAPIKNQGDQRQDPNQMPQQIPVQQCHFRYSLLNSSVSFSDIDRMSGKKFPQQSIFPE